MADPITLSALGAVALTEGIKFLYKQAGEALKVWRKKYDVSASSALPERSVQLPAVMGGESVDFVPNGDVLQAAAPDITTLRRGLSGFADETEEVDPSDESLLTQVNALRELLEAVYERHLTFRGERRPASGTVINGSLYLEQIEGYVAGVRAKSVAGGSVNGTVTATRVAKGASAFGVDAEEVR